MCIELDFFLFEKYGLNENINDSEVIIRALDAFKEKAGWDTKITSKNDRIRDRAREEKQRWSQDREVLLNSTAREDYLKLYYASVREIVEYIKENDNEENSFEEIAAIQDITVDTAKFIFEKHKNIDLNNSSDLNELQALAFKINKVHNAYNALAIKCDDNVRNKFEENGINLDSLFDALAISTCRNANEIEANSYKLSKLAYDLYNRQLFSSEIKNGFMDIFDAESTKDISVLSFVKDEKLDKYFSQNDWVLLRYIRTTCTLMKKSVAVNSQKIININSRDRNSFAQAMNQVFGINFDGGQTVIIKEEPKNQIPDEVARGERALKSGDFRTAKAFFSKATNIDPYCWQAYWGLFKTSVNARTDSEIYFPGFLKNVHNSESSDNYPDYIDYYKSAKFNAAAQKSTEINFTNIELEYKNADKVNAAFLEKANIIKAEYESGNAENISSEKGRGIAKAVQQKMDDFYKWKCLEQGGNSSNYISIFISLVFAVLACVSILSMFTRKLDDPIGIIAPAIIAVIIFFVAFDWTDSFIISILGAGVGFLVFAFIGELALDFPLIFAPVCSLIGVFIFLRAVAKIKKVRSAGSEMEKIRKEFDESIQLLFGCFVEDIETLRNNQLCLKYRIPNPEFEFDYSAYLTPLYNLADD